MRNFIVPGPPVAKNDGVKVEGGGGLVLIVALSVAFVCRFLYVCRLLCVCRLLYVCIYVRGLGRIFASCSSGYKVDTYRTVNGQTAYGQWPDRVRTMARP
jgi:hypothetical protein